MSQAPEPPPLQPEPPDLPQTSLPQQRAPAETVPSEPRPATESPPAGEPPFAAAAQSPPPGEPPFPAGSAQSPPAGEFPANAEQSLPAAADAPPTPPAPPPALRKRRWWLAVGIAVGVVGILAVASTVAYLVLNLLSEDVPMVGDCLTDAPVPDDMRVIDCAATEAYWTVIGSDGTWTHGDFETAPAGEVCQEHPRTQQALWVSNASGLSPQTMGEVVCLAALGAEQPASPGPD